jgi:hypothetical protein
MKNNTTFSEILKIDSKLKLLFGGIILDAALLMGLMIVTSIALAI